MATYLLPGWDSLDLVRRIHATFELVAVCFFAALVVADVIAHLAKKRERLFNTIGLTCFALAVLSEAAAYPYSRRNDELSSQEIASADAHAAEANQRAAEANAKAQEAILGQRKIELEAVLERSKQKELENSNHSLQLRVEHESAERIQLEQKYAPRHLTTEQKTRIVSLLSKFPTEEVNVMTFVGCSDCVSFGGELMEAIRNGGWQPKATGQTTAGGTLRGITLWVKDVNHPPAKALALQNVLKDLGFEAGGVNDSDYSQEALTLFIAPKL